MVIIEGHIFLPNPPKLTKHMLIFMHGMKIGGEGDPSYTHLLQFYDDLKVAFPRSHEQWPVITLILKQRRHTPATSVPRVRHLSIA